MIAKIISRIREIIRYAEDYSTYIFLFLLAIIPVSEAVVRIFFKTGIPDSSNYLQHMVLWITFVGGMITSRERKHLSLAAGVELMKDSVKNWFKTVSSFLSATICIAFAWNALSLVLIGFDPAKKIGFFPIQLATIIMPIGYTLIAIRFVTTLPGNRLQKSIAGMGILVGTFLSLSQIGTIIGAISASMLESFQPVIAATVGIIQALSMPLIIILVVFAFLDTPIFIVLGGIAYLFFMRSGGSLEIIPSEAYTMLTDQSIPTIPLFALAGFILSESKAGERLIRLFRAFFSWMPGGMAIAVVLVCAFFTTFTGASGVTILALGGILSYLLINSGKYSENFTYGLLIVSGSIGLLFPPSLPIILYGVVAQVSIKKLFLAGIIPGLFMVVCLSLMGVFVAVRGKLERHPFDLKEALSSIREGIWELMLPIMIIAVYFSGLATHVETAALTVLYSLLITLVVHRDYKLKDLGKVVINCVPIIGGILIILAHARGLSYYIVDAEIPMQLTAWFSSHVHDKYFFLLMLNVGLLIVGFFMDIYSAIMVVVPLIIPLGALFGIDPVHMGIIFLANLELGFSHPPIGLNLFMASYRFKQPLTRIYWQVLPFLFVLLFTVLVITYVPQMSTIITDLVE
ncbi:MAG TPA: TRAP transporter large permease subunit [Spirochaetota bacterium]|nr:TRAP transporter large permease subunit [Spirochaetota bacterium]HPC39619.1 TRAP transporter large permease subunit [Spirochaetota bacterium]HPL16018.1 TRAP transporter large permease subunit [Spirochaetota bacterium]HQF09515.1 TRAP transporter large permease subunit [Spirochaetota bacterium]HQH98198.1 TRAP transporter large permease subunit [Spirochaetota bacterium]